MSGFSEQRQQLRGALVAAGLSPDAATQIANILGNSAQEMRHAGAVEVDTTPDGMRFVTPEARRLRFPNLDQRQQDPDHRRRTTAPSEERREAEPDPNVVVVMAPQQTDANFQVAPGALTDVQGNGQAAQVNVRNVVAARPAAGLPVALLDSQANRLVGKAPRAQVGQNDGTARLDIQETGQEVLWNLQMLNRSEYDVVTKIEYVDGKGLEITYERIKAWDQQKERVDTIPVVEQPVVTNIVEDRSGLRGEKRVIPAFSSRSDANAYFNTFRVGRFSGGWAAGTTKLIEQVWPTSRDGTFPSVTVHNLTHPVADTQETKYVLYAPRTNDSVVGLSSPVPAATSPLMSGAPLRDANGELVDVGPNGVNAPAMQYYAIEIQSASDCTAFSSLNGKTVTTLPGYDVNKPSALSYEWASESGHPCLKWRSHLVTVITGVELTTQGLVFTRRSLYVLGQAQTDPENIVIAAGDCPPPEA